MYFQSQFFTHYNALKRTKLTTLMYGFLKVLGGTYPSRGSVKMSPLLTVTPLKKHASHCGQHVPAARAGCEHVTEGHLVSGHVTSPLLQLHVRQSSWGSGNVWLSAHCRPWYSHPAMHFRGYTLSFL